MTDRVPFTPPPDWLTEWEREALRENGRHPEYRIDVSHRCPQCECTWHTTAYCPRPYCGCGKGKPTL